jgi:hypothetical protein
VSPIEPLISSGRSRNCMLRPWEACHAYLSVSFRLAIKRLEELRWGLESWRIRVEGPYNMAMHNPRAGVVSWEGDNHPATSRQGRNIAPSRVVEC